MSDSDNEVPYFDSYKVVPDAMSITDLLGIVPTQDLYVFEVFRGAGPLKVSVYAEDESAAKKRVLEYFPKAPMTLIELRIG